MEEEDLEQFQFNSQSKQNRSKDKFRSQIGKQDMMGKEELIIKDDKKKIKRQKKPENNVIRDQEFDYIWNLLRGKNKESLSVEDLIQILPSITKKPIQEEKLIQMINLNNDQLYEDEEIDLQNLPKQINYEDLKAIFYECNIK